MFDPRIVMAEAPEVVVMAEAKDGEIPDKKWRASLQNFEPFSPYCRKFFNTALFDIRTVPRERRDS